MKDKPSFVRNGRDNRMARALEPRNQAMTPYQLTVVPEGDEGDAREYWPAVRRHIWLVGGIALLVTVATVIYELGQNDVYESSARLEIDREKSTVGSTGPLLINDASDDSVYFNTQLQILSSPGLLRRVVKTLDLEHNRDFFHLDRTRRPSYWVGLMGLLGLGEDTGSSEQKDEPLLPTTVAPATARENLTEAKRLEPYVAAILRGLKIEPIKEMRTEVKETRLIDISFNHSDPQLTAKVANTIADAMVYANLERKMETNAKAGDFLQRRIADLQGQIRHDEERLINYARNNEIISLDPNQNTVVERLAGLNRELLQAENDRSIAETAYKAALSPGAADAMVREGSKAGDNTANKLADLRQRRALLLVDNTEEWPEVKEIEKQIAELENHLKSERRGAASAVLKNLQTRYRQTQAREQGLRNAFNQQRNKTIAQNEAAINYRIIQQGVETNKTILQGLLQHSKENDITQAGLANNVHVIDYATTPQSAVGRRRLLKIGLAFVLSLGFAIALVLAREHYDTTIRSGHEAERKLQLPVLAVVPTVDGCAHEHSARLDAWSKLLSPFSYNENLSPALILHNPSQTIAEVYRHLRAALVLSKNGGVTTLLVTSSLPGEGKTVTAVNTALTLADAGANVLLVDADLRRPRLHGIFNVDNGQGLSDGLTDCLKDAEVMALIKKPPGSGLSLITAGRRPGSPAKLFDSEKLRRLIALFEANFTHIIIDSPPIFPFSDGILLSAVVDGVLIVVHGGKSPQEVVLRSKKLLEDVDAQILGVVINNTRLQSFDTYYQTYCQRYYGKDAVDVA